MAKKKTSRKAPATAKPSPAASASTSSSGSGSTAKKKTAASTTTASKKKASSKKPAAKKKAAKKAATRKTAAKKTASKKKATKKAATRKTTAKKSTTKKTASKKKATKKAATRKTATRKTATKKTASRKSVAKPKPTAASTPPVEEIIEQTLEPTTPVEQPAPVAAAPEDTVEASFDALFGETATAETQSAETQSAETESAATDVAPEPSVEPEPEWVPVDEIEPMETAPVAEAAPEPVAAQPEPEPEPEPVAEVAPEPVVEVTPEPEPVAELTLDPEPVAELESDSPLDGLGWLGEDDPFAEPAAEAPVAAPVNVEGGDEVLLAASERGETGLVRSLLDGGASPSSRDRRRATIGWTPLMLASASGHAEVAALLIAAGAELDATDDPDARYAARVREMARSLSPDQISAEGMPLGRTALHLATAHGRLEIAKMLVSAGCAVDVADHSGERPLMLAAQSGALEMAQVLLERDVDVNARDGRGGTGALERAAMMGHADLVGRLLERGATIDSRDAEERTPLMYAVGGAHYEAARVLLENRANPRAEAASGFCVLCAAVCARGYFPEPDGTFAVRPFPEESILPVVELLLRWGADDAPDSTGVRPSQHAEGLGHFGVVRVLYDYSGDELRKTG